MIDYSFLNESAKEAFEYILEADYQHLLDGAALTQSPIEQVMWIYIARMLTTAPFNPIPQKKFEFGTKKYIADIAIVNKENPEEVICVVECDGHDYHEKTKEQAAHDRSRDRVFQSEGIPIFRFTGSEIHKDPRGCLNEIRVFLKKIIALKE